MAGGDISKLQDDKYRFTGSGQVTQAIWIGISRALSYLRDEEIIHNDIKPENILWDGSTALLCDFGLAAEGDSVSCGGGSAWYIAPEFWAYKKRRDFASDMYSFGVVMLFCSRQVPLPSRSTNWDIHDDASEIKIAWFETMDMERKRISDPLIASMVARLPRHRPIAQELVENLEERLLKNITCLDHPTAFLKVDATTKVDGKDPTTITVANTRCDSTSKADTWYSTIPDTTPMSMAACSTLADAMRTTVARSSSKCTETDKVQKPRRSARITNLSTKNFKRKG